MFMKATFLGHATVYLETSDTKILIDPFFTGNPKAAAKASDLNPEFIVLTHGHSDHTADAVPIAKRTGATIIATFELGEWLARGGVTTSPQNHGGWCKYPFGAVKFTPAFHSSSVTDDSGRPIYLGEPAGVIIQVQDKVIFHAGDTAHEIDRRRCGNRSGFLADRRAFRNGAKRRGQGCGVPAPEDRRTNPLWYFPAFIRRPERICPFSCRQGGGGIDSAVGRESGGVKELSGMVCDKIRNGEGMKGVGSLPNKKSVPPRWKMALLSWIAVWPTSMFVSLILKPTLGRNFPHVLAAGLVAGGIVVILYWIAMPLLTRLTRRWLYSEKKT